MESLMAQKNYVISLTSRFSLLKEVTSQLSHGDAFSSEITKALKLIGSNLDLSRIYLFENKPDGSIATNTYEWCNTGVPARKMLDGELLYHSVHSFEQIKKGHVKYYAANITDLPDDLRGFFAKRNAISAFIAPLFVRKRFAGFLGIDHCDREREWTDMDIDFILTIVSILSGALERDQLLNNVEENNLQLKVMFDSPHQGVWDWNLDTGIVHYSDTWCRMLGYDRNELAPVFTTWEKLIHPDDLTPTLSNLSKLLSGETGTFESIHRLKTRDGDWKWILSSSIILKKSVDNQPVRISGTHTDISAQKETEEELKKAVSVRNKIFSIIAHDLRGHISNFIPALGILTENDYDEQLRNDILSGLQKSSIATFHLLENLLNWSRYQTNKIKIKKTVFNLNDLVIQNLELFETNIKQKNIRISCDFHNKHYVSADKDMITMVIRNLISNALKFSHPGGSVKITFKRVKPSVILEIADEGVGIAPEVLDNLFDPNNIYSSYDTNREKGTGIGLLLVREFIELNDGRISAESEPDKGSRFRIVLKQGNAASNATELENSSLPKSTPELQNKRILVIEDDRFNQCIYKKILTCWGMPFEMAGDGNDALNKIKSGNYDLLILDNQLPDMSGLELTGIIRGKLSMNTPIIIISGDEDPENIQKAFKAGIDDYIVKPFNNSHLLSKIKYLTEEKAVEGTDIALQIQDEQSPAKKLSDLTKLKITLGNDTEIVSSMIKKFLKIAPEYLEEILSAYDNKDYDALSKISHKMKSSVNLVAAKSIVNNVRLINLYSSHEKNHARLGPLIRYIRNAFPQLCKELQIRLNSM